MHSIIRRLRAATTLAISFSAVWVAGALVAGIVLTPVSLALPGFLGLQDTALVWERSLRLVRSLSVLGLGAGAVFGALLTIFERGRPIAALSRRRVCGWGVLSGAVFLLALKIVVGFGTSVITVRWGVNLVVVTGLGGCSAMLLLDVARGRGLRGEHRARVAAGAPGERSEGAAALQPSAEGPRPTAGKRNGLVIG